MRRRGVGTLLVAAVVAALVWWWPRQRPPEIASQRPAVVAPLGRARGAAAGAAVPAWIGQPGLPARHVAGHVYADGVAVRGATVWLTARNGFAEWPLLQLSTDAAGAFDLGTLPAARYRVSAHAPGRDARAVDLDLRAAAPAPRPDALELQLPACFATLYGTIRDASGGVIAGARVRVEGRGIAETHSDERGAYELCVAAQSAGVRVAADGYGERVAYARAMRRTRLDVTLTPEVVIAGRVVDGAGGPGAAGVVVTAVQIDFSRGGAPAKVVVTGEGGSFRVDGLGAGTYWLGARGEGRAGSSQVRVVRAGTTVDDVVIALAASHHLRGVVRSAGAPVAGAVVGIDRGALGAAIGDVVSGADGGFSIEHAGRGPVRLAVEGYEVLAPKALAGGGDRDGVVVEVARLGAVRGTVRRAGRPYPDALVTIRPSRPASGRASFYRNVDAAADGSFTFTGVPAGGYVLNSDALAVGAMATSVELTLASGEERRGVVLELDLEGSIAGVVVDERGAPVAGAQVRFECPRPDLGLDVTDDAGRFHARAMSGGCSYRTTVLRGGDGSARLPPAGGGELPAFELRDGATHLDGVRLVVAIPTLAIRGRVLRAGQPVADVTIEAYGDPDHRPAAKDITDVDGRFELAGLAAGEYTLRSTDSTTYFEQKVAAGASDVRIELPAFGAIAGEVAGVQRLERVVLSQAIFPQQATVRGASFRFDDVPPGRYRVEALGAPGELALGEVTVAAGETATLALRAQRTAKVIGTLRDLRGGGPVAGEICTAYTTSDPGASGVTDGAGRFELTVPAGLLAPFGCQGADARRREAAGQITAAPGSTALVELWTYEPRLEDATWPGIDIDPATYVVRNLRPEGVKSGFAVGDRLVAVDGIRLPPGQLRTIGMLLGDHAAGAPYEVAVVRDGQETTIQVMNPAALP